MGAKQGKNKKMAQTEDFKIVVVGAGGVGKSGLTLQFCAGKCPKRYDPTIEDSYRKSTEVDGRACTLDILDTAGQEEYASLRGEYMQEGKGFVLVYSVTNKETFNAMDEFREQIEKNKSKGEKVPICLVGNKIDLETQREVSKEDGEKKAAEWKAQHSDVISEVMFMETSAMMKKNVDETFKGLVKLMMKDKPAPSKTAGGTTASTSNAPEATATDEPKTSGDKGGGCKCTIQ